MGACASRNVEGVCPPSMDSELFSHCGCDDESGDSDSTDVAPSPPPPSIVSISAEAALKISNVMIAPCISIDHFAISSQQLGVSLRPQTATLNLSSNQVKTNYSYLIFTYFLKYETINCQK